MHLTREEENELWEISTSLPVHVTINGVVYVTSAAGAISECRSHYREVTLSNLKRYGLLRESERESVYRISQGLFPLEP